MGISTKLMVGPIQSRPVHGLKLLCPAWPVDYLAQPVIPVQFLGPANWGPSISQPSPTLTY